MSSTKDLYYASIYEGNRDVPDENILDFYFYSKRVPVRFTFPTISAAETWVKSHTLRYPPSDERRYLVRIESVTLLDAGNV